MSYLDMYKEYIGIPNIPILDFLICCIDTHIAFDYLSNTYRLNNPPSSWRINDLMNGYMYPHSDPMIEIRYRIIDVRRNIREFERMKGHRFDDVIFFHPFSKYQEALELVRPMVSMGRLEYEADNYFRALDKCRANGSPTGLEPDQTRTSYEPRSYEYSSRSIDYRGRHYSKFEY